MAITHYGTKGMRWGVRRKRSSTSRLLGKADKDVIRAKKRRTQTKKYLKELNQTMKKNWSDADRKKEMKNLRAQYKSDLNATPKSMKAERKEIIKTLVAATLLIIS